MTTTRRDIARLAFASLLAIAAFTVYHVYLRELMLDTGLSLGAARPGKSVYRIVPLYIYWRPRLKTGALIAAAVLATFVFWLRRAIAASGTRESANGLPFLAALVLWHIAIAVSVALIDGGPQKLWEPYTVHRQSDYIGAVGAIENPRAFLRDYPRLMPQLPLHCRTHPPGGPLFLWLAARLVTSGPIAASLATILISGLAVPAVYLLARDVLDEPSASLAAGLFMLAPNVVAYSATCMDAVFMVPLVWSFYFLWHGRNGRWLSSGIAGGIATSTAAMLTFSTSFLVLWSVVLVVMSAIFDRSRLKATMLTIATAALSSVVVYALLYAWSDYNSLAVFTQSLAGQAEAMAGRGHNSLRQSLHFAVANLIAFSFCSGVPLVLLGLRQTLREFVTSSSSPCRWLLLSFGLTLLLVDIAPLYTLETERIWIFLVGFPAIAAATNLSTRYGPSSAVAVAALTIAALQTILMEVLLDWVW